MTVWMDFNPLKYFGIDRGCGTAIVVSDDIIFGFFLDGGHFTFSVNLKFKGIADTFPLYMRLYNLSGILLFEGEWSEAT